MQERIKIGKVNRTHKPNRLLVYDAESSEKTIRFYINKEQYVRAEKNEDGTFEVKIKERKKKVRRRKKVNNTKRALDRFLTFSFIIIILYFVLTFAFVCIGIQLNHLTGLIIANVLLYITLAIDVAKKEWLETSKASRSKHSAEHMMVNFLEKNRRLPISTVEVKKASRFSKECGTRYEIIEQTEMFVQGIITAIIVSLLIELFYPKRLQGIRLEYNLVAMLYIVLNLIMVLFSVYHRLEFLAKSIAKLVSIPIQCCNTTKYVKTSDLRMAYYAAREWLKIVYPEFYRDEDDSNPFFN